MSRVWRHLEIRPCHFKWALTSEEVRPQAELRDQGRPGSRFLTIRCFILMSIHFSPNCELSLEGGIQLTF